MKPNAKIYCKKSWAVDKKRDKCIKRDFACLSLGIPYRVVIIPMKKLSIAMATVDPWVCVSGELGDSGVRQIPKNTQEIFFQVGIHPSVVTSQPMETQTQRATLTVICGFDFSARTWAG